MINLKSYDETAIKIPNFSIEEVSGNAKLPNVDKSNQEEKDNNTSLKHSTDFCANRSQEIKNYNFKNTKNHENRSRNTNYRKSLFLQASTSTNKEFRDLHKDDNISFNKSNLIKKRRTRSTFLLKNILFPESKKPTKIELNSKENTKDNYNNSITKSNINDNNNNVNNSTINYFNRTIIQNSRNRSNSTMAFINKMRTFTAPSIPKNIDTSNIFNKCINDNEKFKSLRIMPRASQIIYDLNFYVDLETKAKFIERSYFQEQIRELNELKQNKNINHNKINLLLSYNKNDEKSFKLFILHSEKESNIFINKNKLKFHRRFNSYNKIQKKLDTPIFLPDLVAKNFKNTFYSYGNFKQIVKNKLNRTTTKKI